MQEPICDLWGDIQIFTTARIDSMFQAHANYEKPYFVKAPQGLAKIGTHLNYLKAWHRRIAGRRQPHGARDTGPHGDGQHGHRTHGAGVRAQEGGTPQPGGSKPNDICVWALASR